MTELKLEEVNEYIFSPFNTFIYLDMQESLFIDYAETKERILKELNSHSIVLRNKDLEVVWSLEDSEEFKKSKGVFSPPGSENSFVMASISHKELKENTMVIEEEVSSLFSKNKLRFKNIKFYFYDSGVGTCSVTVKIQPDEPVSVNQLEDISEKINDIFKDYFEEISYQLAKQYIDTIKKLEIPFYEFDFLPSIEHVVRSEHFIPWTHRIYHIHDEELLKLSSPGEPFRFLLTPSRKMDIEDFSIYDNRYIYFGWGHSLILTCNQDEVYSQTSTPVCDYVRLVEIAQAKWQFLDVLNDLVGYAVIYFKKNYHRMDIKEHKEAIRKTRSFDNAIDRIMDSYREIKITFDTEKRLLLNELHDRWLTEQMQEILYSNLARINDVLEKLLERQQEKRDESLNIIALIFTIVGVTEILGFIAVELVDPVFPIAFPIKIVTITLGTILVGIAIALYLRLARKT